MKNFDEAPKTRLAVFLILAFILFFALIVRLGYIQIVKGEELRSGALEQWIRDETIKPKRGYIYDRNGKKLAVNKNASTVWLSLSDVAEADREKLAKGLAEILNLDEGDLRSKLNKASGHEKIKQWISDEELEAVKKFKKEEGLRGIQIVDDYVRYYPYNNFASHIMGFTDIDNIGLYGLEQKYDEELLGRTGKWIKTSDANGRQLPFDKDKVYEAEDGLSLVLTIDETIQQLAEKAVEKSIAENGAKNISVIAMEPSTGDVLAMVNKPDYNPNNPRTSLNEATQAYWDELEKEGKHDELQKEWYKSWRNYAINDIYEPGSTFKLITAAAALEENRVNQTTPFYCDGFIRDIKGEELKCSSWFNPHRDLTFQQGMNSSCNIVFVKAVRLLGKEQFLRYIRAFGFGEKTGIDLNGEEYGIVPRDVSEIRDIRLATMSYGHGIASTPIQLVNAVSTITNGGNLMKPRVVKALVDSEGNVIKEFEPEVRRKVISEETSQTMLEMMETVVSNGSGKRARIPGYRVGGKTGTAEKVIDGRYIKGKYIGSFVGVAPIEDPRIVVLVIVDDPNGVYYGGTTAAPIARDIIEGTLKYLEIDPAIEEGEKKIYAEDIVEVPDLVNRTIAEAGEILNELNLKHMTNYVEISENSIIVEQSPSAGTRVEKGRVIDLKLGDSKQEVSIPDLMEKSEEEIREILDGMGANYKIEGEGICVEQSPEAGQAYSENIEIIIRLE